MRKLLMLLLCLFWTAPAIALIDDFETVRNFVTQGVDGTGWDQFFYSGGVPGSLQIQSGGGKLRIQSQTNTYNAPWDIDNSGTRDVAPSLTVNLTGDFVAITRFLAESGTAAAPVFNQAGGLIARNPNPATENVVQACFFPVWTGHITWHVTNDARSGESGTTYPGWSSRAGSFEIIKQYSFMKLERVGSEFRPYISQNGVEWLPLVTAGTTIYNGTQTPVVWNRPDMPATVQVGLHHVLFSTELGWMDFDFLYAGKQVASISPANPIVHEEGETGVTMTITLTGPAHTAEVQAVVIPYALPYGLSPEANDPNDIILVGSSGPGKPLTLSFPVGTTQKSFVVKAVDDDLVEGIEQIGLKVLTYSADPAYSEQLGQWALVTVIDDEQGFLEVDTGEGLVVDENQTMIAQFSVSLPVQPVADVVVTMSSPDGQTLLNPTVLTLTEANYATPQIVTVQAVDDAVVEADPHTGRIVFSVSSGDPFYHSITVPQVTVQIYENDCGAWGFSRFDANQDCVVNLLDLAVFASQWAQCTLPHVADCLDLR